MAWLKNKGIKIQYATIVSDLEMDISGETKTTTAIQYHAQYGDKTIKVRPRDLVFVTTGSIVYIRPTVMTIPFPN